MGVGAGQRVEGESCSVRCRDSVSDLPYWESVGLAQVTHSEVSAWVQRISEQLAAATVRYAHRVFRLRCRRRRRRSRMADSCATSPFGVPLPRVVRASKRFLTHEQVSMPAESSGRFGTLIRDLSYTGLGWGEVAALRVQHVDMVRRRIEVVEAVTEVGGRVVVGTTMGHQRRTVPVPRFLAQELSVAVDGKVPEDLVFTAPGGGVLRNTNFRPRFFDRAARAAGLDGLTPHALRHTAASLAVAAGANVKSVQQILGHASAAMTLDVYAGLFGDDLDAVAVRLDVAVSDRNADQMRTAARIGPHRSRKISREITLTRIDGGAALGI